MRFASPDQLHAVQLTVFLLRFIDSPVIVGFEPVLSASSNDSFRHVSF